MSKNISKEIMEQVMQIMAERDESIRQAFNQINQQLGQSFGAVDFKMNVILSVLKELGVTQETVERIHNELHTALKESQNKGGDQNEPYNNKPSGNSGGDTGEQKDIDGEGGDEHFGNN